MRIRIPKIDEIKHNPEKLTRKMAQSLLKNSKKRELKPNKNLKNWPTRKRNKAQAREVSRAKSQKELAEQLRELREWQREPLVDF